MCSILWKQCPSFCSCFTSKTQVPIFISFDHHYIPNNKVIGNVISYVFYINLLHTLGIIISSVSASSSINLYLIYWSILINILKQCYLHQWRFYFTSQIISKEIGHFVFWVANEDSGLYLIQFLSSLNKSISNIVYTALTGYYIKLNNYLILSINHYKRMFAILLQMIYSFWLTNVKI